MDEYSTYLVWIFICLICWQCIVNSIPSYKPIFKISIGFQGKASQIEINVQEDLTVVYTDGNLLEQILLNLLRNALQASDKNQKIKIECHAERSELRFIIKDNGSGIPTKHIDQVFEPFYTTRQKGSGLGLAITKRLLDQLGGTIRITSQPESGTEIYFSIPYHEKLP